VALARTEDALGESPDQALAHAERAAALAPSSAAAHAECGTALARAGKHDLARARFEKALLLAQADAPLLARLGGELLALGETKLAVPPLRRAVGLAPHDEGAWTDLGLALFRGGDDAGAVEAFRAALAVNPDAVEARNGQGAALLESGKLETAEAVLGRLVSDHPEVALAWSNLARTRRLRGERLDLAAEAIQRARALEPRNPEHSKEAGRIALAQLKLGAAEAAFTEALALAPDDIDATLDLATVVAKEERPEEARKLLTALALRYPDDERIVAAVKLIDRSIR
jgi:Flp pilus assembly protein TadD